MIESLTSWIIEQFPTVFDWVKDALIWFANKAIEGIAAGMEVVVDLLPNFTLPTFNQLSNDNQLLTAINYYIPLDCLATCIGVWVASEIAYVTISPVLRWFKLIGK